MRGRKPKPLHLHIVEGTTNATRHRARLANEPRAQGGIGPPPDYFTPEQIAVWDYGIRWAAPGLLKSTDRSVFTTWAVAVAVHKQAAEQLAKMGVPGLLSRVNAKPGPIGPDGKVTMVGGDLRPSPLLRILNQQAIIVIKAASELGMSPASRGRVQADPRFAQDDPDQEFFRD